MSGVTLRIDGARWAEHLRTVAGATPGLVPVIKGNGYGFGLARLAAEAETLRTAGLGAVTIAVGLVEEVDVVREHYAGDIVVLTPWRPSNTRAVELLADDRVITTVSRVQDVAAIAALGGSPRVLLEVLTSMRRHGMVETDLARAIAAVGDLRVEGWTIHLPLLDDGRYAEAERLSRTALAAYDAPLWLSHLPVEETLALARQLGGAGAAPVDVRSRVGTRLWLGDPASLSTVAGVLDVHRVRKGERTGYRQRAAAADGWIVGLSGGTSHGISLEAPTSASSVRQRAIALATGGLEAAGRALSPYTIAGKKRWFLEPPHMQSSLIFLPAKVGPPAVGDELPVELRLTTATVDHVLTT
ncbi:MAG: alanine racemase [Propionibacteriaceae bacterium]